MTNEGRSRAVDLNRSELAQGDTWQSLETFLVVTTGEMGATGIKWVEVRMLRNVAPCPHTDIIKRSRVQIA